MQIPIIVFGLSRLGLEPTIYYIPCEHATDIFRLVQYKNVDLIYD
jgi:hypothetical protein